MFTTESLQYLPAGADGEGDCSECGVAGTLGLQHRTGANEEVVHPPHLAVSVHYTGPVVPSPHPCRALLRGMRQQMIEMSNENGNNIIKEIY